MNLASSILKLGSLFPGRPKAEKLRLLLQQRELLQEGIETTAEVIQISLHDYKAANMILVQLWLKLKKPDGSFIYTHGRAPASFNSLPQRGQFLRIKYMPQYPGAILILQALN